MAEPTAGAATGLAPTTPGPSGPLATHYKWLALSNTTLGMLAATVNASIVIIALPAIFRGIQLNPLTPGNVSYLLWMLMGYLVVSAVLVVTLGRLGDIYGRVRMYNAGFAIFGLAALALPFDPFTGPAGVLSIGIFFSLMIAGLAAALPKTLTSGLTAQGVPHAVAVQVGNLPPVGSLFAAFLGENPVKLLLAPTGVLAHLPATSVAVLTGRDFFPQLISQPFHHGLVIVFATAMALLVIAAGTSLLRGGKYIHEDQPLPAGPAEAAPAAAAPAGAPLAEAAAANGAQVTGRPPNGAQVNETRSLGTEVNGAQVNGTQPAVRAGEGRATPDA